MCSRIQCQVSSSLLFRMQWELWAVALHRGCKAFCFFSFPSLSQVLLAHSFSNWTLLQSGTIPLTSCQFLPLLCTRCLIGGWRGGLGQMTCVAFWVACERNYWSCVSELESSVCVRADAHSVLCFSLKEYSFLCPESNGMLRLAAYTGFCWCSFIL